MNIIALNESVYVSGTSLVGQVDASYKELTAILGEPSKRYDDDKSDAEWQLQFADGQVATIYNYKDGTNYLGADGLLLDELRDWHIGGKSGIVATRIQAMLDAHRSA